MYKFYYDVMHKIYGDNLKLLYTDTDSLIYNIQTDNVYTDMSLMGEYFDFSDYPKEHPCYSELNKKMFGKFKDELNGK